MAARTRSRVGKPPEKVKADRIKETLAEEAAKILKKREKKRLEELEKLEREQSVVEEPLQTEDEGPALENSDLGIPELPYKEVPAVPNVPRKRSEPKIETKEAVSFKVEPGFKNRAPLQADERAREILRDALRQPICLTGEDLMNVSEPLRQEMKRLVTKKRVEQKVPAFSNEAILESDDQWPVIEIPEEVSVLLVETLPLVDCEVLDEEREGLEKGAIVIGDPIVQYLATLAPGVKPKEHIVAKESCGLKAVYPTINRVGEVESLLDSGSQIVSMAKHIAEDLGIVWDPGITIEMESANRSVKRTLGLAKNIPFVFGSITVYLQVHVMDNPAYKILLGRPFETVTESLVRNDKDGCQSLILTDPNTGKSCIVQTYERGRPPTILKRPVPRDFQSSSMN